MSINRRRLLSGEEFSQDLDLDYERRNRDENRTINAKTPFFDLNPVRKIYLHYKVNLSYNSSHIHTQKPLLL